MANEEKKDFNAMLQDSKDMPKFQIITDQKSIEKYGGNKMYFESGNILPGKAAEILQSLSQPGFLYPLQRGPVISVPKTKLPIGGH